MLICILLFFSQETETIHKIVKNSTNSFGTQYLTFIRLLKLLPFQQTPPFVYTEKGQLFAVTISTLSAYRRYEFFYFVRKWLKFMLPCPIMCGNNLAVPFSTLFEHLQYSYGQIFNLKWIVLTNLSNTKILKVNVI